MKLTSIKPIQSDLGLLIIRIGFGGLMAFSHGYRKLQYFDDIAPDFYDFLGLGMKTSLVLAIMAELLGAVFLVPGLFTRPALFLLIVTMAVAVFDVHGGDPISDSEHALLFLVAYIGLFFTGPGKLSIDAKLKM